MARAGLHADAPTRSGRPEARRSLQLLWWIPLSPIVGFLFANRILSDTWPLWQVVPLVLVLAAPFAVGAASGFLAIRRGDSTGWIGLFIHLAMMTLAISMPISESLGM